MDDDDLSVETAGSSGKLDLFLAQAMWIVRQRSGGAGPLEAEARKEKWKKDKKEMITEARKVIRRLEKRNVVLARKDPGDA